MRFVALQQDFAMLKVYRLTSLENFLNRGHHIAMQRRYFIKHSLLALAGIQYGLGSRAVFATDAISEHQETRNNPGLDIDIPANSRIRIVAESGKAVLPGADFRWHGAPDGGACFATDDGGWIYVSNSELPDQRGGVGAIRFDANGRIADAYPILEGTTYNCAGGKSLKGTWLSCEEFLDKGQVYECDPYGKIAASVLPDMGTFTHEAVAADPESGQYYMTEDLEDGCLYRYTPDSQDNLAQGKLEVAVPDQDKLVWQTITDPSASQTPCRYQVEKAAHFKGGEGIIYHDGFIFFTTKLDNRVWRYTINSQKLDIIYDVTTSANPVLSGVDNIEVTANGELIVAEDGGDMQLIALDQAFKPFVFVAVHGQDLSELTGPAFSPDGKRFYFSSQRGLTGRSENGITYEIELDVV